MRVGVIDVGSNTIRLLVAKHGKPLDQRRAMVALGDAVEQTGAIPEPKLAEAAEVAAAFVAVGLRHRVERMEVLVTSPGRQAANGDELLERLAATARVPVRLLSAAEEGRLAFLGAVTKTPGLKGETLAVCDVGGGSAQVTIGTREGAATWTRSIDIGSRRLTTRCLGADPPGEAALLEARAEVTRHLNRFIPPRAHTALAVGGSVRALRTLLGTTFGAAELDEVLGLLARTPADELAAAYGLDRERVPTLAAGTLILACLRERLGLPLRAGRGGIREGAALELASRRKAA
jgi:exopolyphosphatase/guanosine-5'-triphosphate,3'-diphosphate pyrophosphatase